MHEIVCKGRYSFAIESTKIPSHEKNYRCLNLWRFRTFVVFISNVSDVCKES
jgi:hypothetical protein